VTSEADEQRRAAGIEIAELFVTMSASDSVELKMTVVPDEHRTTIANLPIDPVEAQPRQVFFFDTPDLRLNEAGVVVRARRIQGGRGDTVVKLRPVVPNELPQELRRSPAFNVEVDILPGLIGVCSASMKGRTTGVEVGEVVRGVSPLRKLFTKDQRAFYKEHAPADIDLDALQLLGPTFILKSVFQAPSIARRFVAEAWFYPDGTRILELSTRCLPGEAMTVARDARQYLEEHGVTVGAGTQQTKTKTALGFFSAQLREAGGARSTDIALGGEGSDTDGQVLSPNADDADDVQVPEAGEDDAS
jgi:hypothetical protein